MRYSTLEDLRTEIGRQAVSKRDYTAPPGLCAVRTKPVQPQHVEVIPPARDPIFVADKPRHEELANELEFLLGEQKPYAMTNYAQGQMAEYLGIPRRYFNDLLQREPELLAANVNRLLYRKQEEVSASESTRGGNRLVRTLDGNMRAWLSQGYRTLDYIDLANVIIPLAEDMGLEVKEAAVTDTRLYICLVSPRLRGDVKVGDEVQAGITIKNSEVGAGALDISDWLWRLVCLNGMVGNSLLRQAHIGKSGNAGEGVEEFFSDAAKKLDDAALFTKCRDVIQGWLSEEAWSERLGVLQSIAATSEMKRPELAIKDVTKRLDLSVAEGDLLLGNVIRGGDLTQWGMANAVTALAHNVESYDRAAELQRAGHKIVELPQGEWERIADMAA